jgi:hypothetical protein
MHKARLAFVLAALVVLAAVAPSVTAAGRTPVLPATAHPHGQTYSQWAADWWQWALEQPTSTNPLVDPTGAQCANGQQGKVWFLAGTITGEPVTRNCTIRTGTALLFPVVNAFECVNPGDPNPGEAALRERVAYVREATNLSATIDGAAARNLTAYFEDSEVFFITLPEDNIFGAPAGVYGPCVDAGIYLLVHPLPPGQHTIHFTGDIGGFVVDVTYNITTVAGRP